MKFNPSPGNKKQAKKQEEQKRQDYSNIVRHAEYQAMQEKIDTPFGKTFKTGAQIDKKKEMQKGVRKHKRREFE